MRHRYKVAISATLIALLLALVWLLFRGSAPHRSLSFGQTTTHDHFPDRGLIYADQIAVTWVTNTGRSRVTLEAPYSQFEREGRLVQDRGSSWAQAGPSADLPPGKAMWLAYGFGDAKRLRICFEYRLNGGPWLRAISKAAGVLPLKKLPQRIYDWLLQNGIVDGFLRRNYEGPWIANPQGGAG
jgi:hypothetical protein